MMGKTKEGLLYAGISHCRGVPRESEAASTGVGVQWCLSHKQGNDRIRSLVLLAQAWMEGVTSEHVLTSGS